MIELVNYCSTFSLGGSSVIRYCEPSHHLSMSTSVLSKKQKSNQIKSNGTADVIPSRVS